ncbi:MAG TPA: hypothetical protein VI136_08010 [Verrucomicrobiae bacterium]
MSDIQNACNGGLRSYNSWLQEIQVSDVTGWRWRKRGWITVQNISGRAYIEQAEINRFIERVKRGDFAQRPVVPVSGGWSKGERAARSRHRQAAPTRDKGRPT